MLPCTRVTYVISLVASHNWLASGTYRWIFFTFFVSIDLTDHEKPNVALASAEKFFEGRLKDSAHF